MRLPHDIEERYNGAMKIVYHEQYVTPLPEGHRFPMPKFSKVYSILQSEGIATPENTYSPDSASSMPLPLQPVTY